MNHTLTRFEFNEYELHVTYSNGMNSYRHSFAHTREESQHGNHLMVIEPCYTVNKYRPQRSFQLMLDCMPKEIFIYPQTVEQIEKIREFVQSKDFENGKWSLGLKETYSDCTPAGLHRK